MKLLESGLLCEHTDIQISLEIENVKDNPVELFDIASDIMNSNVPIKYLTTNLSTEDIDSLNSLAQSKSLKLNYNHPILEISYEQGIHH